MLAAVGMLRSLGATAAADLVVREANVLTLDPDGPRAEAFAIKAGRFVAVGDTGAVERWVGPGTRVVSARGRTVVPGFVDAHLHPSPVYPENSRWAAVDCSPAGVRSIDELVAALRRKAGRTPPGQWVLGSRYQETKLGRHPTRWDLDRASTNHPILISHSSGHQSVGNSLALRLAGVNRETADPPGGRYVRDDSGEPNGLLQERAAAVVRSAGPARATPPEPETVEGYRECFRRYLAKGITSIHAAGASPGSLRLMERARSGGPPIRLHGMWTEGGFDEWERNPAGAGPARPRTVKLFHGNSLSAQTCWLSRPYEGRPGYYGVPPARSQSALDALILRVHTNGLQAAVHCNGDREIDMVVTAFERAIARFPRTGHRHRIEHGSVMTLELLRRIASLGLVVAPHSYLWEHGDKMEPYGAWRWEWMHPARAMLELGIPMAGNSDAPVSAADPLLRIQDMVTRTSAEGKTYGATQRIPVEEAIRIWTLGGAYAEFAEQEKGSIALGKLADFVVLGADPRTTAPGAIKDIKVLATYVGGEIAWEAP